MNFLKLALFLILTVNCNIIMSQDRFIRYQDFELAYRNNPDLETLSKEFDLLFILLLDSSDKQQFFIFDSGLEELFNEYSNGLRLNESTLGFVTQITDIKKIFNSNLLINKIFNCVFDTITLREETKKEISYPVYLKNNTAIIEISTGNTSDIFYLRLCKGVVQINWLGGTIE